MTLDAQDLARKARELPRAGLLAAILHNLQFVDDPPRGLASLAHQITFEHEHGRPHLRPINGRAKQVLLDYDTACCLRDGLREASRLLMAADALCPSFRTLHPRDRFELDVSQGLLALERQIGKNLHQHVTHPHGTPHACIPPCV